MKILNCLLKIDDAPEASYLLHEGISILLRLLQPITPHVTYVLWQELGYGQDITQAPWPAVDEKALYRESIQVVVQVNGKKRALLEVAANCDPTQVETKALEHPSVIQHTAGKAIRKVIYVPSKLLNIVC